MSLGYAEKLSYREDVGTVGTAEFFDPPNVVQSKVEQLAEMILQSKRVVAFTGAGISTSCGIPDFRGPAGIWTLQTSLPVRNGGEMGRALSRGLYDRDKLPLRCRQKEGRPLPRAGTQFAAACPGVCHMAIVELLRVGLMHFVISQNVDGLHLRSGVLRRHLAELHGNCFRETCPSCSAEYVRDFEIETIGLKATGRRCTNALCRGRLRDSVLDWEDELPAAELRAAEEACSSADLVLCLGTSLQVTPAANLPLRAGQHGGRFVIVNLQKTPKDKKATLVIRSHVDQVMAAVMARLGRAMPAYVRVDGFLVRHSSRRARKKGRAGSRRRGSSLQVAIESIHGARAPLPLVSSVQVDFPGCPGLAGAHLTQQPFTLTREVEEEEEEPSCVKLTLHFGGGSSSMLPCAEVTHALSGACEGSRLLNKCQVAARPSAVETLMDVSQLAA